MKQRSNESSNVSVPADDRGQIYQGMFMAPCGSTVMYMTDAQLPDMKNYRRLGIQDHLAEGECESPRRVSRSPNVRRVLRAESGRPPYAGAIDLNQSQGEMRSNIG